jgi:hypothetical protein
VKTSPRPQATFLFGQRKELFAYSKTFKEATMASLLDTLNQQLNPDVIRGMSRQIGADERQTEQAISALLPMMIGGMARNATSPEGSAKLSQAVDRDHDGSLLDQVTQTLGRGDTGQASYDARDYDDTMQRSGGAGDMLSGLLGGSGTSSLLSGLFGGSSANPRSSNFMGILNNVFGGQNVTPVQQGVSRATGLDSGKVGTLMAMLAPMVMGALGKVKRQQNLDSQGLARVLEDERQDIERQVPEASGISRFLDSNRDGKVDMRDDIAKVGMALGGAMLLSRMRRR